MFSEMDTDTFLAFVKAHQRVLQQQAELDALWRRASCGSRAKHTHPDGAMRCCTSSGIANGL